jgi:hypothetical protein
MRQGKARLLRPLPALITWSSNNAWQSRRFHELQAVFLSYFTSTTVPDMAVLGKGRLRPAAISLWLEVALSHAGLLLTNSSRSPLVTTPRTNFLPASVTTAKSCFSPLPRSPMPSKKPSTSHNSVSIVTTL